MQRIEELSIKDIIKRKIMIIEVHMLSTVRHADQIVVLQEGEIAEFGTHDELTVLKGRYFDLVKNQLELGV